MNPLESNIQVNVDPTNPGQFFACCGLLELADRLWGGAEGWFSAGQFHIRGKGDLPSLMKEIVSAELSQLDPESDTSSPIEIRLPVQPFRLDWWNDQWAGGRELKVWAGTMESVRIAKAMQHAIRSDRFQTADLFNAGAIAFDPNDDGKKVEPYYFDARRCPNAHSRDVGFSPNDLQMTTTAYPAVELLCLVGLQRSRPAKTRTARVFDYFTWTQPIPPMLLPPVVAGTIRGADSAGYRFENWYRTGQKKHKAFRSSIPLGQGDRQ